ncbi:MAG: saccharopine dehydrogenase NADP-binding domain-containing protein, partial [Myxococcota bacterium]
MTPTPRVIVLGASGTLGGRIVDLLRRELPEVRVVAAGRHPERLDTPEVRRLDLDDPDGFPSALVGARALVHAAGPFDHDGQPLVAACLRAGVDYLDLAEDPAFLARVRASAQASGTRSRIVPGCSTVPGLVALLAHRFEREPSLASIDAYLCLGSRNPVSRGLLYGLLRPIGSPAPHGTRWFSRLVRFRYRDGRERSLGRYPLALEKGVELSGRPIPLRLFVGFDRALLGRALVRLGRVLPSLSGEALARLVGRMLPLARAWRPLGSPEGRLALVALDPANAEIARLEIRA